MAPKSFNAKLNHVQKVVVIETTFDIISACVCMMCACTQTSIGFVKGERSHTNNQIMRSLFAVRSEHEKGGIALLPKELLNKNNAKSKIYHVPTPLPHAQ